MIDKVHQIGLMRGAIEDYHNGLMTLAVLVSKIDGLLSVIDDKVLWDKLFDAFCDLEQVNASSQISGYDYEQYGRPVVDRALREIIAKTDRMCGERWLKSIEAVDAERAAPYAVINLAAPRPSITRRDRSGFNIPEMYLKAMRIRFLDHMDGRFVYLSRHRQIS